MSATPAATRTPIVMYGTLPPPIRNVRIVTPLVAHPGHMLGTIVKMTEQHAPRLPEADEACHGGLARGERVALDLHVEEVLHGHAEHRGPQKAEPDGRGHVRPDDVLPGPHAQSREDDARAEDLAERQRLGHVPVRHRRQVAVRNRIEELGGRRSRVPREKEESCRHPTTGDTGLFVTAAHHGPANAPLCEICESLWRRDP